MGTATVYIGTETLVSLRCGKCGTVFAITQEIYRRCLDYGDEFWCPLGHCRVFTTSRIDAMKAELEQTRSRLVHERDQREATERSLRATKGAATKLKKRVAAGVCPCCSRTFQDLARHMAGQHPDYPEPTA